MQPTRLRHRWAQNLRERLHNTKADESGITTLEWLLIVAAVAGLAALAVVLVQNVVSETSEQIAGSSARKTAASVAAAGIQQEAKTPGGQGITDPRWNTWNKWDNYFTAKCNRLLITFSDAIKDANLVSTFTPKARRGRGPASVGSGVSGRRCCTAPSTANPSAQAVCEIS